VIGDLAQINRRLAALQTLEKAGRRELDEVAIPNVAGCEQRQVVPFSAARWRGGVVGDEIDLAADYRLDPALRAGLVELDSAVHYAMVGESEGRLTERRGALRQGFDFACPIQ
jgi:hypothetical protein